MEGNFQACLRHVFAMEGGFSEEPSDHGGATNWGITAATLAHWRGHAVTAADVRAGPRAGRSQGDLPQRVLEHRPGRRIAGRC